MADSTFAEHVATTNIRLASLRANLIEASTFPEACSELTKWCQDQRAFTAHFEDNLMLALEAAMEYGTRENYDYMLTHGLVGACFTHRKHLSKIAANRISRWYEQMRRLKKNGGKRKRAPPKPKEPLITSIPPNVSLPGLTSPTSSCPLMPPPPLSSTPGAPQQQQSTAENNNFMFSPTNSDGSMWAHNGIPMSQPGSSAGHMPPPGAGAMPAVAPYPGQMNPPGMNPAMTGYPGGQMQLPYGQLEGNQHMYDQRMAAANRAAAVAAAQAQAAGRPPQGMMPDYTQMPMGQNPGANGMMRMPVQYPPGHPQMAQHPQMQYGQMMRAPPVSVYGQMAHGQPYAVTAHPNPAQPQRPIIHPEVQPLYENTVGLHIERDLISEGPILSGSNGIEVPITPDSYEFLRTNHTSEVLLSVWSPHKGANDQEVRFEVFVNGKHVMSDQSPLKSCGIKQHLIAGTNHIQFGYNSMTQLHNYACEFVTKRTMAELRRMCLHRRQAEAGQLGLNQRAAYAAQASKRQAGFIPINLNCSLNKKRMFTPARHHDCKKVCFDLASLISQNKSKTRYYCQPCNVYFKFEDINIDYFLLNAVTSIPLGINEIIVDKNSQVRPGEHEDTKPKRGKKKAADNSDNGGGAHTMKRIKSETMVKQEPGVFPDMHGRNIPFSPMPMPGSVPPDWTRLQSPSFSMQSPNKVQLGSTAPGTPAVVFQNPASAGSMLNMSSPRQTMMPGYPHGMHPMMPPHEIPPMRSGSAPYTPESVKMDKNDELLMNIDGLFISNSQNVVEIDQLMIRYMDGTKDTVFEDSLIYELPTSPKQQDGPHTMMAPGSTSSSNASTFTPPFDDIHLGNRPSH
ncbi:unnamed protein product [Caenorhabditis brenneri]